MNIEKVEVGVRHMFKGDVFKSNNSLIGISTQNFVFICDKRGLKIIKLEEGFKSSANSFHTFYIWEKG